MKSCLIKSSICLGTGGRRLGHDGDNTGFMTGNNFLTLEVAPIGNHGDFFDPHGGTGLLGHGSQLVSVDADVRDFMRHNQMVRCIDRRLDVVADDTRTPSLH